MPILQSSDSHPLHSRPNRELSTRIRKNLGHVCASTQAAGKIGPNMKNQNERFAAVLEIPPVGSAQKAVQVQILKDVKGVT
jgi:hypothetical protein